MQGFGIIAGFTIDKLFMHLSSIGLNTVGTTVLHIFTGAAITGGNGFGLQITDLQEHTSPGIGFNPELHKHAAPYICCTYKAKYGNDDALAFNIERI